MQEQDKRTLAQETKNFIRTEYWEITKVLACYFSVKKETTVSWSKPKRWYFLGKVVDNPNKDGKPFS